MSNEKEKKTLAYKMGQLIGVVLSLCICALMIGITVGLMMRMF